MLGGDYFSFLRLESNNYFHQKITQLNFAILCKHINLHMNPKVTTIFNHSSPEPDFYPFSFYNLNLIMSKLYNLAKLAQTILVRYLKFRITRTKIDPTQKLNVSYNY